MRGSRRLDDLVLERGAAIDMQAAAIARYRHVQRQLQARLRGAARDFQLMPVVADRRRASAIDERAMLGDAVLPQIMRRLRPACLTCQRASGQRVSCQALLAAACAQGGQRLCVAGPGTGAQPVRPGKAAMLAADGAALSEVAAVDAFDVRHERLRGCRMQDAFGKRAAGKHADGRPLEPAPALRLGNQALVLCACAGQRASAHLDCFPLLLLVKRIQCGRLHAQAQRLASLTRLAGMAACPGRPGSEWPQPRFQARPGTVAVHGAGLHGRAVAGQDHQAVAAFAQRQPVHKQHAMQFLP